MSADLRPPDCDDTPLSREEVLIGLRKGLIPDGPYARAVAFGPQIAPRFAQVVVTQRRCVEVFDFGKSNA